MDYDKKAFKYLEDWQTYYSNLYIKTGNQKHREKYIDFGLKIEELYKKEFKGLPDTVLFPKWEEELKKAKL